LDANDVDFAREVFADFVVAWTYKHSRLPKGSETHRLADMALKMAQSFNLASKQAQLIQNRAHASAQLEPQSADRAVTLAQLVRDWGTRIVARAAGRNGRDLVSRLNRYVSPHLGNRPASDRKRPAITLLTIGW